MWDEPSRMRVGSDLSRKNESAAGRERFEEGWGKE